MNITKEQIAAWEAEREQLRTSAQTAVTQINEQIKSLTTRRDEIVRGTNEGLIRLDERIRFAKELRGDEEE